MIIPIAANPITLELKQEYLSTIKKQVEVIIIESKREYGNTKRKGKQRTTIVIQTIIRNASSSKSLIYNIHAKIKRK